MAVALSPSTDWGVIMWHMETGDRAMTTSEWELFRSGLSVLVDAVEDDIAHETDEAKIGI